MADPLAEAAVSNSGPVRDIITAPWMAYRVYSLQNSYRASRKASVS